MTDLSSLIERLEKATGGDEQFVVTVKRVDTRPAHDL